MLTLSVLFVSLAFGTQVEAATLPDGFLIGDESGIKVSKQGGYFFNLENIRPGDTTDKKLIIKNQNKEPYRLHLEIKPKSHQGKINLIEALHMTMEDNNGLLYDGNLCSNSDNITLSSKDLDFGIIQPSEERTISIHLKMTSDSSYWDFYSGESSAEVLWQFAAVTDIDATTNKTDPPKKQGWLPQTGEKNLTILALIGVGISCFVGRCFMKKSQKTE
ncbi:LPXTG cell wall anchor domain-containing protein [Vagococcus proximus]|nr:LPXTG cell wall anchor domain-containing protein [Vagococcus proximus]